MGTLDKLLEVFTFYCEEHGCINPATVEYIKIDQEVDEYGVNSVYVTFRCDDHPEEDEEYQINRELDNGRL